MRVRTWLLGALFLTTVFVLLPKTMMHLNAALGWPRWQSEGGRVVGLLLMMAGIGLAVWCSSLFRRMGFGTPVPIEPPTRLVVSGIYGYSRNPIYVSDLLILLGLFFFSGELALLIYTGVFWLAIHCFTIWVEEPSLMRRFGDEYRAYMERVPRWLKLRAFST